MKKLFLILLVALVTCAEIEESFDDDVVLEKGKTSITVPTKHTSHTSHTSHTTHTTHTTHTHPTHTTHTTHTTHITHTTNPTHTTHITHSTNPTHTTKLTTKITPPNIPKKTVKDILKVPIKGINGLFHGKVGEIFRKLGEVVKKGIAWLKKNNLWKPLVDTLRDLGERYGNEYCTKILPDEVCGPAVDFILNHVLGKPEEKN